MATSEEEVVERDFEDYKADAVRWDSSSLKTYGCHQCGSQTEVDPHITAWSCPFCGSDQVEEQTESRALHKPESLLPFEVDQETCLTAFKAWVRGLWFRPNALKTMARPDRLRGVYLPYWTYDALTASWWKAESGTYYYVEDSEGNRVRKTRWRPSSGDHQEFFDDVLIEGSPSVKTELLRDIEPFDTSKLVPYSAEYLSGMAAEDYRQDMKACWPAGKGRMDAAIHSACAAKVPGDTHRGLRVSTQFSNRTYKLVLLPIWVASYRYRNAAYTYIVNGQSGEVSGTAPWSVAKIVFAVLSAVAVIGGIVYAQNV